MGSVSVKKIKVSPLRRVPLPKGDVLHGLKRTDTGYTGFGEAYFSQIEFDAVKAWKRHTRMTLNLVVPVGIVKFAFVDDQDDRLIKVVSPHDFVRLTVPPGIWFGFKGLCSPLNLLLNIADIPHDPAEVERKDINEIEFDWKAAI